MIKGDGYYIQKCKLLPIINPNFNMLNTPDDLIKLLPHTWVVSNSLIDKDRNLKQDKIIGIVQDNEFTIEDGFIYGDVFFSTIYGVEEGKIYDWVNAECIVDMIDDNNTDGYVTRVVAIEFKEMYVIGEWL